MAPDKIHIAEESNTELGVGQTGQYIYPISKCCRVRADRRTEMPWGHTTEYDAYYCSYCDTELELYESRYPEYVALPTDGEAVGLLRRASVELAVRHWTNIPVENLEIEIKYDKDTN